MITPAQIPDEAVEAAVKAFDDAEAEKYVGHYEDIRAAIAAALAAWPEGQVRLSLFVPQEEIVLPLPLPTGDA